MHLIDTNIEASIVQALSKQKEWHTAVNISVSSFPNIQLWTTMYKVAKRI